MKHVWVIKESKQSKKYVKENLKGYTHDIYKARICFTRKDARYDKTEYGEVIKKVKVTLKED